MPTPSTRCSGSAKHPGLTWGSIPDVAATLKPLYDAEPDRLVWFDGTTPRPVVESTLATLRAAGDHGLNPADYDAASLSQQWTVLERGGGTARERAYFDLGVSVACARILKAVHGGRVDPATMDWGYAINPSQFDVADALRKVSLGSALSTTLDTLQPHFSHYLRARKTLAAYRTLAQAGEPAVVPDLPKGRPKIAPGQTWVGVPQLTARLRILGDLPPGTLESGSTYTGPLVDAVKRFQGRHGLDVDGVIGAGTIKALNVPLAARVRQIELAMERMRWLPPLSDRPNVFVNVPLFRLWADDPATGAEPLRMNVVVGKSLNHKTPIFVEQMEYVIFRPYWNPPRSITVQEIVPKARHDPGYMAREALEIVASDQESAAALPADAGEPDAPRRGQAPRPPEAGAVEFARAGQVHLPERRERLHARHARRSSCSHARAATSATAASGSRIPRASPNGCCAISRTGRVPASTRPCRRSGPRASI